MMLALQLQDEMYQQQQQTQNHPAVNPISSLFAGGVPKFGGRAPAAPKDDAPPTQGK